MVEVGFEVGNDGAGVHGGVVGDEERYLAGGAEG